MARKNLWKNYFVAVAYSYQQKAKPYLELLEATDRHIQVRPGEQWLDLGCGSGRVIETIWEKSRGQIGRVVGVDISLKSLKIAKRTLERISDEFTLKKLHFVQSDIRDGLSFRGNSFDGITAGLCLSYADYWDAIDHNWNKRAYISLLEDIFSVLKDGGTLIFSTNVPNPNFTLIALRSWRQIFLTWKAPWHILICLVMLFHSRWLKRGAVTGRFHYLPAQEVIEHLKYVGFESVTCELTYAGQAWVFSAVKTTP